MVFTLSVSLDGFERDMIWPKAPVQTQHFIDWQNNPPPPGAALLGSDASAEPDPAGTSSGQAVQWTTRQASGLAGNQPCGLGTADRQFHGAAGRGGGRARQGAGTEGNEP